MNAIRLDINEMKVLLQTVYKPNKKQLKDEMTALHFDLMKAMLKKIAFTKCLFSEDINYMLYADIRLRSDWEQGDDDVLKEPPRKFPSQSEIGYDPSVIDRANEAINAMFEEHNALIDSIRKEEQQKPELKFEPINTKSDDICSDICKVINVITELVGLSEYDVKYINHINDILSTYTMQYAAHEYNVRDIRIHKDEDMIEKVKLYEKGLLMN